MTDERYNFVPREYWPRLGPAFQGIDRNIASIQDALAAGGGGGASVQVVTHGANAATPRPDGVALVIWEGSVAPANAADTDFWRVP